MANGLSIFDFQNYSQYLLAAGRSRTRAPRGLTYSQWARQLRYRSPRGIAMVLQGKRLPSPDMVQRLSRYLSHSEAEHRYLEVLVAREKEKRKGNSAEALEQELWRINPKSNGTRTVEPEDFVQMRKWHFYPIKQLIDTAGFREDVLWIRRRLRNKVSVEEIRETLRVLSELGLTRRDAKGRLRTTGVSLNSPTDFPFAALREHHRGLVQRGIESMEEQAPTAREFGTLTLRASPEEIPRIKEAIRHFINQFDKTFENLDSEHVFQLNIQFFEHTTSVKGRKKP